MNEEHKSALKIGILLLVLFALIISVAYYVQKTKISNILTEYNGFKIKHERDNAGNIYEISLYLNDNDETSTIFVRTHPKDLESIPIESDLKPKILKKEAFITLDPAYTGLAVAGAVEISKVIGNQYLYGIPTKGALTKEVPNNDAPIKTCADADADTAIIRLLKDDKTKIYSIGECVVVEGETEADIIRASDRLVLTMLGIMKE